MRNYSHYIFEVTETDEALSQMNEQGEKIVSTIYLTDSNQMLVIVEKTDLQSFKKFIGKDKDEDDK